MFSSFKIKHVYTNWWDLHQLSACILLSLKRMFIRISRFPNANSAKIQWRNQSNQSKTPIFHLVVCDRNTNQFKSSSNTIVSKSMCPTVNKLGEGRQNKSEINPDYKLIIRSTRCVLFLHSIISTSGAYGPILTGLVRESKIHDSVYSQTRPFATN